MTEKIIKKHNPKTPNPQTNHSKLKPKDANENNPQKIHSKNDTNIYSKETQKRHSEIIQKRIDIFKKNKPEQQAQL